MRCADHTNKRELIACKRISDSGDFKRLSDGLSNHSLGLVESVATHLDIVAIRLGKVAVKIARGLLISCLPIAMET